MRCLYAQYMLQTASAISIVVMAAAAFPEAQRRVQEQLDLIVGKGRSKLKTLVNLYLEDLTTRRSPLLQRHGGPQ